MARDGERGAAEGAVRRLTLARFVSWAGTEAAYVALIALIFDRSHGSGVWISACLLSALGTRVLVSPLAGTLGDYLDRRVVMVAHDNLVAQGLGVVVSLPTAGANERQWPVPLGWVFGGVARPSDRLFHVYSNRQLHEATDRDALSPYLLLYVPLRLRWSIFVGYLGAILAYALAATYAFSVLLASVVDGHRSALFGSAVGISVLAASLSLCLTTTLSDQPVIHQKLVLARHCLEGCVFLILLFFTVFGLIALFDHGIAMTKPRACGDPNQLRRQRSRAGAGFTALAAKKGLGRGRRPRVPASPANARADRRPSRSVESRRVSCHEAGAHLQQSDPRPRR